MDSIPKQMVLLKAYEELTEKETFCLREANIKGMLELEDKKAKLLEELQRLAAEADLSPETREEFNRRVSILLKQEKENEIFLEKLMQENRAAYKKLSQNADSASKIRRAYGKTGMGSSSSRTFKDQA